MLFPKVLHFGPLQEQASGASVTTAIQYFLFEIHTYIKCLDMEGDGEDAGEGVGAPFLAAVLQS